jgi:hypothetical protein
MVGIIERAKTRGAGQFAHDGEKHGCAPHLRTTKSSLKTQSGKNANPLTVDSVFTYATFSVASNPL